MNSYLGYGLALFVPFIGILICVRRLIGLNVFPLETFERREKLLRIALVIFILWFILGYPFSLIAMVWEKLDVRDVYSVFLLYLMATLEGWRYLRQKHFTHLQTLILHGVVVGCGIGIILCHLFAL